MPIFFCELCDFRCSKTSNYTKHLATQKHKNQRLTTFVNQKKCRFLSSMDEEENAEKMPIFDIPKKCRFSPSMDEDICVSENAKNHIFENVVNTDISWNNVCEKTAFFPENAVDVGTHVAPHDYQCITCMRKYKDRSGLWRHRLKCTKETINTNLNVNVQLGTIVCELMKQNQEIKEMLVRQNEQINELNCRPPIIQQITNTTHNHFNLNVFLNEQCKDALNISEFVDKLQIQFSDLECVGKMGYVEGISRIIANELNQLSVYERPIHCTDIKRETIYIKDQNQWNRETKHAKIKMVIDSVANKNMKLIPEWYKNHPGATELDSSTYNQHMSIMIESIGGLGGSNETVKEKQQHKIIKNVLRNVYLEKDKHLNKIT